MFHFFNAIFVKVASAVASIIIAVGLVSAPVQQPEPPQIIRVITDVNEASDVEIEQTSSTIPNSVSVPAPAPAKTPIVKKETIAPASPAISPPIIPSSTPTTIPVIEPIITATSTPIATAISTTTPQVVEVSFFANEFKFSSHIYPKPIISLQDPEKIIISATGYRNNYAVRGWFKWWTINQGGMVIVEETLNSVFLPMKEDETIVPLEFTGEIPINKLSPHETKGYTKHYFQFYFERGSSKSYSEPIEFAEGY